MCHDRSGCINQSRFLACSMLLAALRMELYSRNFLKSTRSTLDSSLESSSSSSSEDSTFDCLFCVDESIFFCAYAYSSNVLF